MPVGTFPYHSRAGLVSVTAHQPTPHRRPGDAHSGAAGGKPTHGLAGFATVTVLGLICALAVTLFRGDWTDTVPVTVISDRAGLVMNPDAKVKIRGVQVGQVSSLESLPDGNAVLHLSMNKSDMHLIPSDVTVDIASSTVFGAKFA